MGTERELKLACGDAFVLPTLNGVGGLAAADLGDRKMRATYWDTDELSLVKAHWGLRYRTDGGWTLKGPSTEDPKTGMQEREEDEVSSWPNLPPQELLSRVASLLDDHEVHPVLDLVTLRHAVELRRGNTVVGEVVHDRCDVLIADLSLGTFAEVEIEVTDGDAMWLSAVRDVLIAAGAAPTTETSKYVRALEIAGLLEA